jgi:hypothetical protein
LGTVEGTPLLFWESFVEQSDLSQQLSSHCIQSHSVENENESFYEWKFFITVSIGRKMKEERSMKLSVGKYWEVRYSENNILGRSIWNERCKSTKIGAISRYTFEGTK